MDFRAALLSFKAVWLLIDLLYIILQSIISRILLKLCLIIIHLIPKMFLWKWNTQQIIFNEFRIWICNVYELFQIYRCVKSSIVLVSKPACSILKIIFEFRFFFILLFLNFFLIGINKYLSWIFHIILVGIHITIAFNWDILWRIFIRDFHYFLFVLITIL
jgi:hypothetical protein